MRNGISDLDLISDETPEGNRWKLTVFGIEIPATGLVQKLVLSSKFGRLVYGKHPLGYPTWAFFEEGGGGSVIVPFCRPDKKPGSLFIGVVSQMRYYQDSVEKILNVPRGFLDPGESHFKAASREVNEEFGHTQLRVIDLGGEPFNPNSAFFVTDGYTSDGKKKGVRFYAVEFPRSALMADKDGNLVFKPGAIEVSNPGTASAKAAEGIFASVFLPWQKAAELGDGFTLSGMTRLNRYLALNP